MLMLLVFKHCLSVSCKCTTMAVKYTLFYILDLINELITKMCHR